MSSNKKYGVHLYTEIDPSYKKLIDRIRNKVPVDVEKMARKLNIKVFPKLLGAGVSGAITRDKDNISIYYDITEPETRQRFTIAHEIAHYLLGHLEGEKHKYMSENTLLRSNQLSNSQERDANYLAAELLMPMKVIDKLIDEKKDNMEPFTLDSLAQLLGVAESALRIRLGII